MCLSCPVTRVSVAAHEVRSRRVHDAAAAASVRCSADRRWHVKSGVRHARACGIFTCLTSRARESEHLVLDSALKTVE
jgi:hypothetical protein